MKVENLFTNEIQDEIAALGKMELGNEQYDSTVKGVSQLTDRLIKMKELENEREKIDVEKQKVDVELKKAEDEENDRKIKNRIAIGTAVGGAIITVGTVILNLISEEKGILTTTKAGNKSLDRALNYFFKK